MNRETKAERVFLREKIKMTDIGAIEAHIHDKVGNPTRWLEVEAKTLEGLIVDYNNVAFEQDADVIMCFKMTPTEYAEATKEALDGLTEDKDDM